MLPRAAWLTAIILLSAIPTWAATPSPAPAAIGQVLINEVNAGEWSLNKDQDGDYKDWVELFNPTSTAQDISFWGLSNKDSTRFRWVFPPGTKIPSKGYLMVWLSKKDRAVSGKQLHTSFNLDNGQDMLFLTAPDGTISGIAVDSTSPPRVKADTSWCRIPSGNASSPFGYCAVPTFGKANSGAFSTQVLPDAPVISPIGGTFDGPLQVGMSVPEGTTVRYTIDGSVPTSKSSAVSGPITVSATTMLRAASFNNAGDDVVGSSFVTTETFVIDTSASTTYANQRTMFVTVNPGDVNKLQSSAKQRVVGTVDLRERDNTRIFKTDVELRVAAQAGSMHGQSTYPLNVNFRDSIGDSDFTYPLFPLHGTQTLDRMRLRNGGEDWWYTHFRDQFAQSLLDGPEKASDSAPVALFINGKYKGLMDMREREDETLIGRGDGTDDKDVIQYMSDSEVDNGDGTKVSWDNAYSVMNLAVNDANWQLVAKTVDYDGIAQTINLYGWSQIWDWPWRNNHKYRNPYGDGKWHIRPHDLDIAMDSPNEGWGPSSKATQNAYSKIEDYGVWSRLMRWPVFKTFYLNVVADHLNTLLSAQTTGTRLDAMVAEYSPYIEAHRAYVSQRNRGGLTSYLSDDVQRLRNFLNTRPDILDSQTQTRYKLGARQNLTVNMTDPSHGIVTVNTVNVTKFLVGGGGSWTGGYYPEVPITMSAQPAPGYRFVGWQGGVTSSNRSVELLVTAPFTVTAVFERGDVPAQPVFGAIAAQTNATGDLVNILVAATNADGFPLSYSAKGLPKGLSLNTRTGRIYGKITTPGASNTRITATNGWTSSTVSFSWTVNDRPGTGTDSVVTGAVTTEWFKTATPDGTPLLTDMSPIALNEPSGTGPRPGLGTSKWSVRWTSAITPPSDGSYTFRTNTTKSDGIRVWIGGRLVIDDWTGTRMVNEAAIAMTGEATANLRVEFFDAGGTAQLALTWKTAWSSEFTLIPYTMMSSSSVATDSTPLQLIGMANSTLFATTFANNTSVINNTSAIALDVASGKAPRAY